jgi:hypothetical protein
MIISVSALLIASALSAMVGAAEPAAPAAQPATAEQRPVFTPGPCYEDVQKLCKDVKPGGGRIATCLKEHEGELAPGCRDLHQFMKDRITKFYDACETDIQKFCKDTEPGGGRVVACLKSKLAELSPTCKTEFQTSRPAEAQPAPAAAQPAPAAKEGEKK